MKYEYSVEDGSVFFIGCANEKHMVAVMYKSCIGFYLTDVIKTFKTIEDAMNTSIVNMYVDKVCIRRIIQEPKRWTVEDQKAGRLPEVGCIVIGCDKKEYEVLAQERCELALRNTSNRNLMLITVSGFNRDFKPIETPEEKAERLRSEWCHAALRLINDELSDACDAAVIYDALLSGTLSAPTKGGE